MYNRTGPRRGRRTTVFLIFINIILNTCDQNSNAIMFMDCKETVNDISSIINTKYGSIKILGLRIV